MGNVNYKNKKLRITIAFIASVYMLIHGTRFDFYRAVTSPSFYIVLSFSFIVSLGLIELIHYVTVRLDKDYGWRSKSKERLVAQLLLGLFLPAAVDLIVFSIYFGILNQNIFDNRYFYIDFPAVFFLLIILNTYYFIHYWILTDKRNIEKEINLLLETLPDNSTNSNDTFVIHEKGRSVHFKIRDILYLYKDGKQIAFVTTDNELFKTNDNLSVLEEHFSQHGFLRINRSIVFNFNEVVGYENGSKRNTLKMLLKPKYQIHLNKLHEDRFTVTNEHISNVIRRFS